MIRFSVTGDRQWKRVLWDIGTRFGAIAIRPVLEDLSDKMQRTLNNIFSPGGSSHGYTGEYASKIRYDVSDDRMEITEGVDGRGKFVRTGTSPSRVQNVMPAAVVTWAIDKLGVQDTDAFRIARSIGAHGIGRTGGSSPLPTEHPVGAGRFDFPEWIVKMEHRKDIEDIAAAIGGLTVSYVRSH